MGVINKIIKTVEDINEIPKTINDNGCWIPLIGSTQNQGYSLLCQDGKQLLLHRIVISILYPDSNNDETRHGAGCDRRCFNPDHLLPGNRSSNAIDTLRDGTHNNARKEVCPKCGGAYRQYTIKSRGKIEKIRACMPCNNKSRNARRALLRANGKIKLGK